MAKEKLLSIEWMKFFAALLITNSHLGVAYGRYESLATGGAIGNALFFFCSGFTLALGRFGRFDNWFKRRLYRLYPSVFAKSIVGIIAVLISAVFVGDLSSKWQDLQMGGGILSQLVNGGGWFCKSILQFYVLIYIINWLFKKPFWPLIFTAVVGVAGYFWLSSHVYVDLYGALSYPAWYLYFIVMMMGFSAGLQFKSKGVFKRDESIWKEFLIVVICIVAYYGSLAICRRLGYSRFELISVIPFFCLMFGCYRLLDNSFFIKVWNGRLGIVFKFISSHCWEIYLAQFFYCFTYHNQFDKVFPFPLNIPMSFLAIFATAWAIKAMSRLIIQLFNKEDFDWKHIIVTWL